MRETGEEKRGEERRKLAKPEDNSQDTHIHQRTKQENVMKTDILTLCIVATTILASTRNVIGFLTSQTSGASPGSALEQQEQQEGIEGDEDVVIQPRRHLDATLERNVYDPGDGKSVPD